MLIEMHARDIRPDLILFADTGGERPETYAHIIDFNEWLTDHDLPGIQVVRAVRRNGKTHTLEESCLRLRQLPSLAFGGHSCSLRFKKEPQDKYVNHWRPAEEAWRRGSRCIKAIGYDAGETRRTFRVPEDDRKYEWWHPLVEWGLGRSECIEIIARAGIPVPRKSSCFFCPAMKKPEILGLKEEHPDLLRRALDVERTWQESDHEKKSTRGLGRRFAWSEFMAAVEARNRTRGLWEEKELRAAA